MKAIALLVRMMGTAALCLVSYTGLAQERRIEWWNLGPQSKTQQLLGAGRFAEAIPFAEAELSQAEKTFGSEHPNTRKPLDQLAVALMARGTPRLAEPYYKRSLAIAEKAFGPRHSETVDSLNNLLGLYLMENRMTEAEAVMKRIAGN